MNSATFAGPLQYALEGALRSHQRGDLKRAESGYQAALAIAPEHPYALHFLGLLVYQRGQLAEAERLVSRAIARHPQEARFHVNLGNVLRAQGRTAEAEASLRAALLRNPALPEAHGALGTLLREAGRGTEAIGILRTGLELDPGNADIAENLGVALIESREYPEAIDLLQKVAAARARDAQAHYNLGNAYFSSGNAKAAADAFRCSAELRPDFAHAWYNLGNALAAAPADGEAVECFERAVALDPGLWQAWFNMGAARARRAEHALAAQCFRRVLEARPEHVEAHCGLGAALLKLDQPAEAAASYQRALRVDPAYAKAYAGLGAVLRECARFHDAALSCERAHAFDPGLVEAYEVKASAFLGHGRASQAVEAYRRWLELEPRSIAAATTLAFTLNYLDESDPAERLAAARRAGESVGIGAARLPEAVAPPREKLRLGFVSRDLRSHSVGYFTLPLIEHLGRGRIEVWCYDTGKSTDAVNARFRASADGWRDCAAMSDDDLAHRVRADGIDVLIDLSGYTEGSRLRAFARRPSPVQATYLGYPTTTGLAALDYRVSDWHVDPEGAEERSSERPMRLPGSYFCYGGPVGVSLQTGPLPALRGTGITFGSFNNLAKMSPATMRLWARVLEAVPASRLSLKSKALVDEGTREDVARRLEASGIPRDRLVLAGWQPTADTHLAAYNEVDIALDTWPYNGATTTCEALWMGVPVVSLRGEAHVARMGLSILHAAGLEQFVAASAEDYVRIAAALATDLRSLATLRSGMRARLQASLLMDATRFAREFETLVFEMYAGRAHGRPATGELA